MFAMLCCYICIHTYIHTWQNIIFVCQEHVKEKKKLILTTLSV